MPRVTRAALRTHALLEESTVAALTPLPITPVKERVALGEITDNPVREALAFEITEEVKEISRMTPGKTGPGKGKRGKVTKKGKKQVSKAGEVDVEILEDDNQSETSSAVEEACQDLRKENTGEIHQVVMDDQRPRTPPSPAVRALQNLLSSKPQTPRFDPEIHRSEEKLTISTLEEDRDAFADAIISRTPAKTVTTEGPSNISNDSQVEEDATPTGDDPFVAQIQTSSPAKPITRIEDSVEAIDAFEEEIEKIGELIPAMDDNTQLPTGNTDQGNAAGNISDEPTHASGRKPSNDSKPVVPQNNEAKAMRKETKSKPRQTLTSRSAQPATRRPTADAAVSRTSSVRTPASSKHSPRLGASKNPATTRVRVSSLQKAPFQPAKSSKPPTRATFELPGEAISRKLKEQQEERLKKEVEEGAQKKTFKARPVRLSHAPVVKPTATSKARMSLAKADSSDAKAVKNQAPKIKPIAPRESMATADGNKRLSTLSVAKRAPTPSANSSARGIRGPSLTASIPSRTASLASRASLNAGPTRATNAPSTGSVRQTSRGKEVFGRTKAELEAREKERKEKEEAARKARAEASERGRLASRMWAEKQKAKKMGAGSGAEKAAGEKHEVVEAPVQEAAVV